MRYTIEGQYYRIHIYRRKWKHTLLLLVLSREFQDIKREVIGIKIK